MMVAKITDYRCNQRVKKAPIACVQCGDQFIDIGAARTSDNMCPPCRVATGRFEWATCISGGGRYATSTCHNKQLIHECRQCSLKRRKTKERDRIRRQNAERVKRNAQLRRESTERAPVTLAMLETERYLELCEFSERARTPQERQQWGDLLTLWRTPLTDEQLDERKRNGLPYRNPGI